MYLVTVYNPDNNEIYKFISRANNAYDAYRAVTAAMKGKGFENSDRYCDYQFINFLPIDTTGYESI